MLRLWSQLVPNNYVNRHPKTLSNTTAAECIKLPGSSAILAELCKSRGGRPGLPVLKSRYGLCGRKATLNLSCKSQGGRPGHPVPNSPFGLCGRNATLIVEAAVLGSPSLTVLLVSVDVKQH